MTMYDITPIIKIALSLLATVITVFVVPYIKAITTNAQRKNILAIVTTAVTAAEQIFHGSGLGKQKLAWVKEWLHQRGITISEEELSTYIESAVYDMDHCFIELQE